MVFLQDDDSKQQFMVDTGAVCSVLPHRSYAQPAGPQLSGADGRSIPTWGTIRRRLSFGLRTFFVTFFLAAVRRPILGLDFLSAHGLLVDPVGRQVLDSKTLKPLSKTPTAAGAQRSKFAAALCSIAQHRRYGPRWPRPSHRRRRKRQTVAETPPGRPRRGPGRPRCGPNHPHHGYCRPHRGQDRPRPRIGHKHARQRPPTSLWTSPPSPPDHRPSLLWFPVLARPHTPRYHYIAELALATCTAAAQGTPRCAGATGPRAAAETAGRPRQVSFSLPPTAPPTTTSTSSASGRPLRAARPPNRLNL